MTKFDVVRAILGARWNKSPRHTVAKAFAPANIALCKYWGKRDQDLNLPMTDSFSISLADKGSTVELKVNHDNVDKIFLNTQSVDLGSAFGKRLIQFLDLFRGNLNLYFTVNIAMNIPVAAGLASSACGFASLIQALNTLFHWELTLRELSILARLGSGSACRSIWSGFVEWRAGIKSDGMDSHGEFIPEIWPELCIGLLVISQQEKALSSREAMQRTIMTSSLYSAWPAKVTQDLHLLKQSIAAKDFSLLGKTAENNAITMHATMLSAWPPIAYALPETLLAMQKIWQLREAGLPLYFTQDAGPNLKLLFLKKDRAVVCKYFPTAEVVLPFR